MRHIFLAVFAFHVINHVVAVFIAEIDIDIGHAHALRVEKALKNKLVPYGVDVRDSQRVRHQTARGRTSARAHGNILFFRVPYKIPYDKEVTHIIHGADNAQLVIEPGFINRRNAVHPLGDSLPAKRLEIRFLGLARGRFKTRQIRFLEIQLEIAFMGYGQSVFHRVRDIFKKLAHFLR